MKKVWVWIPIVAAAGAGVAYYLYKDKPKQTQTYETISVAKGDLTVKILSTGTVQPENRLEIKSPIAGRVEQVLVVEGQNIEKGQMLAVMSSSERAALLDAARAKGADEVRKWQEFYQAAPILAPIRGTIILRNVEPGQTVTSSDALLVMSDRLTVKAQVDETDLAQIKLRQRAEIVLDAYPSTILPGRVDQIAFEAKTVNNVTTYVVDVLPDTPSPVMRSGMTANVNFLTTERKDVLLIPAAAAIVKDDHTAVLIPPNTPGTPPAEKEVKLGASDGKRSEVLSGLSEGEKIWVPQFNVDAGKNKGGTNPFSPFAPRRR